MTLLIAVSALWVLAATGVAMLPLRRQYVPGVALMLAAPVLIYLLGREFGWVVGLAAAAAFVSMFRNPLRYFWRKWTGGDVDELIKGRD
ncbi:DUF2484 family protein [Falsiruegeria mediterranea]|jgi:Protein of unknown function (DUF2484)